MKHLLILILVVLSTVTSAAPAAGEMCTIDTVPAATLLLPYFEVDLNDPAGATTLFSINNALPKPALVHLIFWTDWAFPTIGFDVYLTGYDVLTVNLRDVFDGNIPITADAPSDPDQSDPGCGTKSPCGGAFSENRAWDDTDPFAAGEQGFPVCDQIFPFFVNPAIRGVAFDRLVSGHTGAQVSSLGACVGRDHGDGVARGYITIDNVSRCSLVLDPADNQYFVDGGAGVAKDENQLWGEVIYLNAAEGTASMLPLVHIEADPSFDAGATPSGYTFYGRYVGGSDNREPLGTTWGTRYYNGGAFEETELVVWRDSTASDITPVPTAVPGSWCADGPSWHPLQETQIAAFDEVEDLVELCSGPDGPACFPYATQKVATSGLGTPFSFGWMLLNLNLPPDSPIGDVDFGSDGTIAQSYAATLHTNALGFYSGGLQMVELGHACEDLNGCVAGDGAVDSDSDGVPDGCDQCAGDDATGDGDGDLVCADSDCDDADPDAQVLDACGVCGGDGSSCAIFRDEFESGDTDAWSFVNP